MIQIFGIDNCYNKEVDKKIDSFQRVKKDDKMVSSFDNDGII